MAALCYEKRPLKRPRLGPPDVYPQDPKQKEDELSANNVKYGYSSTINIADEHGSARHSNITVSKFGADFSSIIAKKHEFNTFQDTGRKKPQINPKDNFWPVTLTPKSKLGIDAWFKDLAGNKPLVSMAKRVPVFNKKEEIFGMLCDHQVPMLRAVWFIKMTAAYQIAFSETKMKKRQLTDPSQEWTQTLTKFLKEQLQKMVDHYHTSNTNTGPIVALGEQDPFKLWQYCTQLIRYLYEGELLDRQEFLTWVVELLEKAKAGDDGILRVLLPLVLQYVNEVTQSELLSRRLAHLAARKLSQYYCEGGTSSPRTQSPQVVTGTNGAPVTTSSNCIQPPTTNTNMFTEYSSCPHHRNIVLSLSCILQVITLNCPSALVWNSFGESKVSAVLNGSPLDILPCAPSSLPMAPRPNNNLMRARIRQSEMEIIQRGRAAEVRWSSDKWQQSSAGTTIIRVLNALDALDRHCFDKVESNSSLDTLYAKIFQPVTSKHHEPVNNDEPLVQLLCEWAVCTQRNGEYRALVVAKLLEKRHTELSAEKYAESDMDDKESNASTAMVPTGLPFIQGLLMKFLDTQAPIIDETSSPEEKSAFANLVLLFSELIRHDVFSHDAYMCTLISRGSLNVTPGQCKPPASPDPVESKPESIKHHPCETIMGDPLAVFDPMETKPLVDRHDTSLDLQDLDDSKIDDELGKLLQHIKAEQQNSIMEQPGSVGSEKGETTPLTVTPLASSGTIGDLLPPPPPSTNRPSRHLLYTLHFPLPQDESANHDCNQRHILLYGVGKPREDARHIIKKITKDIGKLFSKKTCMDISEGGKVKKHAKGEFNFEAVMVKFQNLTYFDQHQVTLSCASSVIELLSGFVSVSSNYLPLIEHVAFLLDLMEISLSMHGLIEFCIQVLKEVVEVEVQLVQKQSILAGSYTPSLTLYIVGILRRYHCWLLVSQEQAVAVFEGLCKVVKHVTNPADCSSAERCILCHLYELYTSCSFLKSKHMEPFSIAYPKIKQTLYSMVVPSAPMLLWNTAYMIEQITSPKEYIGIPRTKLDPQLIKQLNESPANRYSFVCNAVLSICNAQDADRLNEISILCSELTACCTSLSCEWLGVLKALCCSSNHGCGFIDVLTQVDVGDLSIHDSLSVFTAILIARHCISIQDFVVHVALPSLLAACPSAGNGDQDAELGARLTCHLLLRLFKTVESPQPSMYTSPARPSSPVPTQKPSYVIKLSCDRHLLAAAQQSITVGPVLAVLKAILVLGDATVGESKSKTENAKNNSGELSISDILGTIDDSDIDIGMGAALSKPAGAGIESAGLSDFAKHALNQICSQEWVRERCLRDPDTLCSQGILIDNMLSNKQSQQLLHMVCHPQSPFPSMEDQNDQKQMVTNILQNLDLWTLRMSWLELQLMFKHCPQQSTELNQWLDLVGKAAIDIFQLTNEEVPPSKPAKSDKAPSTSAQGQGTSSSKPNSVWLVAPLIAKLPSVVQGRVLKAAGQVLESGNWSSKSKDKDKNVQRSTSLLSHTPFLSLVLTCLKGQDDQREGLLTSLHSQLSQFIHMARDEKFHPPEDAKAKQAMQEALQLRLSLVGGMFDTIQRNQTVTTDWAVLLVQLICYGVIDTHNNSELFTSVLDMVITLIHCSVVSETASAEKGEETKKYYQTLMKKLKKETADCQSEAITQVRQLLPLPKQQLEVIACEAMGSLIDTKGNKIQGFDSIDKKQGLQVAEKQQVSPWDLLEGLKNPAPLSWSWFGAIRMERKPLRYAEAHRLLLYHTHSMVKPFSHYLEPPPLPQEDLEPTHEKQPMKEDKGRETPILDQSPRGLAAKRAKPQKRKPRIPRTPSINGQTMVPPTRNVEPAPMMQTPVRHMNFPDQSMYSQSAPQGWYGQPQQQQQAPQQQYYPQQNMAPSGSMGGSRFPGGSSKAAISSMLRARHPSPQFIAQQQPQQPYMNQDLMKQRQQMMRQQLRSQSMQPPMFPQSMQSMPGQGGQMHTMQQQGISGGYGYGSQMQQGGPMNVDPPTGSMLSPNLSQSYPGSQQSMSMMGRMSGQQSGAYMSQPMAQPSRPQYQMGQASSSVPVNTMPSGMSGQMPSQYGRPMQQMTGQSQQHLQQLRQQQQQQQYMSMQQGMGMSQAGGQQTQQQQQTAALLTQLQRQLQTGQQPPPQHLHGYGHQNY